MNNDAIMCFWWLQTTEDPRLCGPDPDSAAFWKEALLGLGK